MAEDTEPEEGRKVTKARMIELPSGQLLCLNWTPDVECAEYDNSGPIIWIEDGLSPGAEITYLSNSLAFVAAELCAKEIQEVEDNLCEDVTMADRVNVMMASLVYLLTAAEVITKIKPERLLDDWKEETNA